MATKTTEFVPKLTNPRDMIAVDPGNKISAWVIFRPWREPEKHKVPFNVISFGRLENSLLQHLLGRIPNEHKAKSLFVIEMPRASGIPVSNELFETCVHIGRMLEIWKPHVWSFAFRGDIKLCICGVARAKDPNVRAALIEYWGGEKRAMGGKKCPKCKGKGWFGPGRPRCSVCGGRKWEVKPGPLDGMAEDEWAALAVAYWWHIEGEIQREIVSPKTKKKKSKGRGKSRDSVTVPRKGNRRGKT